MLDRPARTVNPEWEKTLPIKRVSGSLLGGQALAIIYVLRFT